MLFGYIIVRVLLVLARALSRLSQRLSRGFARLLDAGTKPFDLVNYLGPCGAVRSVSPRRMGAMFDRVTEVLDKRLAAEAEADLGRGMPYPVRWGSVQGLHDPGGYPTQHFDFHHRQLTLDQPG
jgi:hypothetical protein